MIKKLFLPLLMVLSLFTLGAKSINVDAIKSEEVTFILHKVVFDYGIAPDDVENNGYINPDYGEYESLEGASFDAYDITADYQELLERGYTTEEAQKELSQIDVSALTPQSSGVTDADGIVEFTLSSDTVNTAYLFHESDVPQGINERAANLVVILPFFNEEGQKLSTIHLYPKNESERLSFEKEVKNEESYDIGEAISYQLTSKVPMNPQGYEFLRIVDTADSVLQLDVDSLQLFIGDELVDDIYKLELNNQGFTLDFDLAKLQSYKNQKLRLEYDMYLSGEAKADVNYFNKASINHNLDVVVDQKSVRTGGYRFVKVDRKDHDVKLAGAHFALKNEQGHYLEIVDGKYVWQDLKENAYEFVSDVHGALEVVGLKDGKYYLEEVKAPQKYILSDTPIAFEITEGSYQPGSIMKIVNEPAKVVDLPTTGTSNTMIYIVIGGLLVITGLVVLSHRRKKGGNINEEGS